MYDSTVYYAEQVKFHLAPVISKRLDEYFSAVAISNFGFDYKRRFSVDFEQKTLRTNAADLRNESRSKNCMFS